uniref:hypothetical protein n=1 Tax=Nocardioides sp. TaxID=35761 RepID=UPI00356A83D0
EWGHSEAPRRQWPTRLKRLVKRAAIKKGYVRRPGARTTGSRGQVGQSWSDFFDGLVDAIDCIAPGAESSCRRDLDQVGGLGRSARVALKCGGMAVIVYYSGGTALAAMGAGVTACYWDEAWSAWE